jgi:hypothetical protein
MGVLTPGEHGGPCPHPSAEVTDVLTGPDGGLQIVSCGTCRQAWWTWNAQYVPMAEAVRLIKAAVLPPGRPLGHTGKRGADDLKPAGRRQGPPAPSFARAS